MTQTATFLVIQSQPKHKLNLQRWVGGNITIIGSDKQIVFKQSFFTLLQITQLEIKYK